MRSALHLLSAVLLAFVLILPAACTKNDEQQSDISKEKSTIDQMTDQAAEKAVKKIRTPLDKARATKDLGDDRLEEMDKAVQEQQQ